MISSSIHWMQRLTFRGKAILITSVFALPIAVLGVIAVFDFQSKYQFIQDEQLGVDVLKTFHPVSKQITFVRNATRAYIGGNGTQQEYRQLLDGADVVIIDGIAKIQGGKHPFSSNIKPQFEALKNSWVDAKKSQRLTDETSQNTIFAGISNLAIQTEKQVADLSGIILDPEIDTLYLGLVATQVLPSLIQNLGQLRSWGTYLAINSTKVSPAELSAFRQRYAVWDAGVRADTAALKEYLDKVIAHTPAVAHRFAGELPNEIEAFRRASFAVAMQGDRVDSNRIWQEGGEIFERAANTKLAALNVLGDLLELRMQRLKHKHIALGSATMAAVLLAVFLFYSFYRGMSRDLVAQERDASELRAAKEKAERASKAKEQFLANMSHEIRTPMNGLIGMTELALDLARDPIQRDYLNTVKGATTALLTILNDVLDFSKIEAGKFNIEAIAFSPAEVVEQTVKLLKTRAAPKGLVLECELQSDLPLEVIGDPGRLRQILINLCDNAIKFTSHGGVYLSLQSNPQQKGFLLQFDVRDTGIGIAKEKQGVVFEAFSQADISTTRQFGGTGLGLTICTRLVELMGGKMWLDSVEGQGSTFSFTVQVQSPPQAIASPTVMSVQDAPLTRSLLVLLVEDHPINQKLATTLLLKWGHQVVLAKNGKEAVDLFPTQAWDVVLMDMQMPEMGGLEATRLIRAGAPPGKHTPIVALTANATDSERAETMDAGMDAHLSKPFTPSGLQAVLSRLTQ